MESIKQGVMLKSLQASLSPNKTDTNNQNQSSPKITGQSPGKTGGKDG